MQANEQLVRNLATRKFSKVQLYLASSGETYPTRYFPAIRDIQSLDGILKQKRPAGLDWSAVRYAAESHHSMAQRALYDGLSYVFRGYKPTLQELYDQPERLQQRYERLSARLGEKVMLSEGLLSFFGNQFLYAFNEPAKAAKYFQVNAGHYPQSPNVWNSLGEMHAVEGNTGAAINMYEKALSLDPGNENARKRLSELHGAGHK